jgi:hypothetical protein
MNSMEQILNENQQLKLKIKLYEISTKIDYEKILKLKDEIIYLENLIKKVCSANLN